MNLKTTARGWGLVARAFHWIMAGLILFMLGLGLYMTQFVPDPSRQFDLFQLHKSWGFVVFCLALARIAWRAWERASPDETMPRWQARAAGATHGLLYVLMIVVPISGWASASASPLQDLLGMRNMVFGLFPMPDPWVPGVQSTADAAGAIHLYATVALAAVLSLHVGAALRHALIDRDRVLARMVVGK